VPASVRARWVGRGWRPRFLAGRGRWIAGVGAGVLGVVVAAVGLSIAQSAPPRAATPRLPYPLDIPVAQRTPAQLVQGRLMLPVALLEARQLLQLPPGTKTQDMTPSTELMLRIASSIMRNSQELWISPTR